MKILYVGLLYNYGKPEEGFSYENMNIEAGLLASHQCYVYYPDCGGNQITDSVAHDTCISLILNHEIDAIFHVAFNESLDLPESFASLALKNNIPVIQWDCDSSWRFQNWILPRKNRVSHFVTTHSATVPWYQANGMKVIKSQWAGSPLYKSAGLEKKYDVTFIGQRHGQMPNGRFVRSDIVTAMEDAGIKVDIFGNYWDGFANWHGYVTDFEEVIKIFDQSKICLNISNPWHYGTMPQIKGRHFEIPQVGGLQITTPADNLQEYFIEDKEIVVAKSVQELIDKTKYYLANENERLAIARAGHERMLKDHQWSNRFDHIFKEVGL